MQPVFARSSLIENKQNVAIWSFYEDATQITFDRNEQLDLFGKHCNGKNKVYIYELGGKGFFCNSVLRGDGVRDEAVYDFELLKAEDELAKLPKRVGYTVVTVSMNKIPQQHWAWSAIDKTEIDEVRRFAKRYKYKVGTKKQCAEESFNHHCDPVSSAYGKYPKYEKKLTLPNREIYIVPRTKVDGGIGWELNSLIITKENGQYRYIGDLNGCLINQPVDIDQDGIPELMTELCENYEGTQYHYYKIYPNVKLLILEGG